MLDIWDEYFGKKMEEKVGMIESLLYQYMKETGLKASEIVLVQKKVDYRIEYFYADKKDYYEPIN